jgi:hypothetical protein
MMSYCGVVTVARVAPLPSVSVYEVAPETTGQETATLGGEQIFCSVTVNKDIVRGVIVIVFVCVPRVHVKVSATASILNVKGSSLPTQEPLVPSCVEFFAIMVLSCADAWQKIVMSDPGLGVVDDALMPVSVAGAVQVFVAASQV